MHDGRARSTAQASANIPTKQYGFYIQDDWRVSDRLTLNAGIRYDLVTGLNFDQSKNPNFVKVQAAARAGDLDGIVGLENFGLDPQSDRNNIQPRIGAVYDIDGQRAGTSFAAVGASTPILATRIRTSCRPRSMPAATVTETVFCATNPTGLKNADGSLYQAGQPLDGPSGPEPGEPQ